MLSINDVLLFILPFEVEILIIPISVFAAISIFLNHSINTKKELLVCDIIKEIEKDIKEIARMENRLLELKKEQKSLQPNQ